MASIGLPIRIGKLKVKQFYTKEIVIKSEFLRTLFMKCIMSGGLSLKFKPVWII